MNKLRIMIDTNILISHIVFHSFAMERIIDYISDCHTMVLSSYVIDELHKVTERKFPAKVPAIEQLLSRIKYEYVYTPTNFEKQEIHIRDVKDYPVLYSAVTENIDILITGDKDFSDLEIDKPEILTPSAFMEKYMN